MSIKINLIMKYNSAIIAMFKNESMVIKEWIDHYKWQGIGHIYLLNNDSSDDFLPILQPYINDGYVTLYNFPERHRQEKYYNIVFDEVRNDMEWVITCDIDEYWFGTKFILNEYLLRLDKTFNNILSDWEMFGSCGYDKQPSEIRKSFIMKRIKTGLSIGGYWKVISRASEVGLLKTHNHVHKNEMNNTDNTEDSWVSKHNDFENVRLFHYQVMSKEYWETVKMSRGDAAWDRWDKIRDWRYFKERDFNEVFDVSLVEILVKGYKN